MYIKSKYCNSLVRYFFMKIFRAAVQILYLLQF